MIASLFLQAAIGQRAGVGRYVHTLVPHLAEVRGGDALHGFYFDFRGKGSPFPTSLLPQTAIRWVPGALVQQAWKRLQFPPADLLAPQADVLHFPNFVIPPIRRRTRAVVSIHDASFLRFPETLEPKNLAYLRSQIPKTLQRAERILTISETIAAELREAFSLPAERVVATLLGPPPLTASPDAQVRKTFELERPFLLHVGTLEPRKNHAFLFQLMDALADQDLDLVLCGMEGWHVEPILAAMAACKSRARIRQLRYVTDAQLAGLYQQAEALVFPSLYEGFGLPPVEAMQWGCPVMCSDGGSLPEVVGAGGCVLPLSLEAWREAVPQVRAARARWIAAGRERAAEFSWRRCAEETWQVYREAAL